MASLLDQATITADANFQARITASLVNNAIIVYGESPATSGHAARVALGSKILANPNAYGPLFAWGVAGNPGVQGGLNLAGATRTGGIPLGSGITEAVAKTAIDAQVVSMWNAYM